jgi:hypothetical protein
MPCSPDFACSFAATSLMPLTRLWTHVSSRSHRTLVVSPQIRLDELERPPLASDLLELLNDLASELSVPANHVDGRAARRETEGDSSSDALRSRSAFLLVSRLGAVLAGGGGRTWVPPATAATLPVRDSPRLCWRARADMGGGSTVGACGGVLDLLKRDWGLTVLCGARAVWCQVVRC